MSRPVQHRLTWELNRRVSPDSAYARRDELLGVEEPVRRRILQETLDPRAPHGDTSRRGRKGTAHQQSRVCQDVLLAGPSRRRLPGAACRAARRWSIPDRFNP